MPISDETPLGLLQSSKGNEIAKIDQVIGYSTVTSRDLEFAPLWLDREAYDEEEKNWAGVLQAVEVKSVPTVANVISTHVAYKLKVNEDGNVNLKARICPNGNRDKYKEGIRKDFAAAQFPVTRLMRLKVDTIEISAAYLQ